MYVTDTHPLVYAAQTKLSRLGRKARRIFVDANDGKALIYVPAIVLWEMMTLISNGELNLPTRFDYWCQHLDASPGFAIAPLGWQIVNESRRFPFKDPFDRMIAGTAANLEMPLITKDSVIEESKLVDTVW